ncbi:hypothetical protein TNCV_1282851 [Trichonephila clavipes]|uniref:Uncharacterized protein n=1 Tax=Trichonephila clavipes TaxID=2585209 RepID=A0A8X6VEL8_TRICX|nr:hypothetical protein TNCV_1282851 [Trichonephila clavipes]
MWSLFADPLTDDIHAEKLGGCCRFDKTVLPVKFTIHGIAIAYTDGSSDRSLSNGGAGIILLLPDVTEFDCPRIITSTIARLRTEHLKGMKIHPDKTRSYVQCKHCPDLQLTPNHILECPTVTTKLLKMGMVPLRDSLRELLYSPDAPRIAEAVIETFDGI